MRRLLVSIAGGVALDLRGLSSVPLNPPYGFDDGLDSLHSLDSSLRRCFVARPRAVLWTVLKVHR
jgi:hypothetical protein